MGAGLWRQLEGRVQRSRPVWGRCVQGELGERVFFGHWLLQKRQAELHLQQTRLSGADSVVAQALSLSFSKLEKLQEATACSYEPGTYWLGDGVTV